MKILIIKNKNPNTFRLKDKRNEADKYKETHKKCITQKQKLNQKLGL